MSVIVERTAGVGALIISPKDTFLTIEELTAKRSTAKLPGMKSLPMETVEPGETHRQAISRLFKEEVISPDTNAAFFLKQRLCAVQLTPGVWLHAYLFETDREYPIRIGTAGQEVSQPQWSPISEALIEPAGSMRFRPGVKEVLDTFLASKHQISEPSELERYFETFVRIPDMVFDLLSAGLSQTEALNRVGLHPAISLSHAS